MTMIQYLTLVAAVHKLAEDNLEKTLNVYATTGNSKKTGHIVLYVSFTQIY